MIGYVKLVVALLYVALLEGVIYAWGWRLAEVYGLDPQGGAVPGGGDGGG